MRHAGQVLTRQQLLDAVWGIDFDTGSNVVDVYVSYLRRKLDRATSRRSSRPSAAPDTVSARRRRALGQRRVALAMTLVLAVGVAALCVLAYDITVRATLTAEVDRTLLREARRVRRRYEELADASLARRGVTHLPAGPHGRVGWPRSRSCSSLASGRIISNSELRLEQRSRQRGAKAPTSAPRRLRDRRRSNGRAYRVLSAPIAAPDGSRVGLFQAALSAESPRRRRARASPERSAPPGRHRDPRRRIRVDLGRSAEPRARCRRMAADAAAISHASPGRRIAYDGPADELGSLASLAQRDARPARALLRRAAALRRRREPRAAHAGRHRARQRRAAARRAALRGATPPRALRDDRGRVAAHDPPARRAALARAPRGRVAPLPAARGAHAPRRDRGRRSRARRPHGHRRRPVAACGSDGDPDLLEQALLNLVRNAVAHTQPTAGTIALACAAAGNRVLLERDRRRPGHPAGRPRAHLRPLLPRAGPAPERLGRRGPRARDRAAARRAARRRDPRRERRAARRALHASRCRGSPPPEPSAA